MRAIVIVAVLAMLAMPVQADWLQAGYDATRTSFTPEYGPEWPDTAFRHELPAQGSTGWMRPDPVIVGGRAYVAGLSSDGAAAVFEVDLGTGRWDPFVTHRTRDAAGLDLSESRIMQLVSDGNLLFALLEHGLILGWDLTDRSQVWSWQSRPAIVTQDVTSSSHCLSSVLALVERSLIAACNTGVRSLHVWRVNAATGATEWTYDWASQDRIDAENLPASADPNNLYISSPTLRSEAGEQYFPTGVTVLGDAVVLTVFIPSVSDFVTTTAAAPAHYLNDVLVLALDLQPASATGQKRWTLNLSPYLLEPQSPPNWPPSVTGDAATLYLEWGDVHAYRLVGGGIELYQRAPFRPNSVEGDPGSGLAFGPEGLYATSLSSIHLLDENLAVIRSYALHAGLEWGRGAPVRTGNGLLIAPTGPIDGTNRAWIAPHGGLQALKTPSLQPAWSVSGSTHCTFAVSDGLVVRWCADGVIEVLGHGSASIAAAARLSSRYPAPGDTVQVDLSGTGPGYLGPATEFRADWGDGTETEWQETPVFEHRYSAPLDAHARFFARNSNQSSSVPIVFHVGQADPAVNIFNSPFDDQYQETTFFFLGLLLTGLVAIFGIYRAGRKRRRLARELRELEAAYIELRDDAGRCEAMLAQRRALARELFLTRKLEEAHASFLVTRVDELRHGLRINEVEQRLDFLPLGMVKALREILRDSKITQWERSQFLLALEQDTLMSPKQKAKVLALIDTWFASDATLRA